MRNKCFLIDHHYKTLDRIYWYPRKWQNLLNFVYRGTSRLYSNAFLIFEAFIKSYSIDSGNDRSQKLQRCMKQFRDLLSNTCLLCSVPWRARTLSLRTKKGSQIATDSRFIFCHLLPNSVRFGIDLNSCNSLNVNSGRILPGFGRK